MYTLDFLLLSLSLLSLLLLSLSLESLPDDKVIMNVPPSHESWVERIPNWFKFAAAAVTGLIGFIVLVQDNFELSIVAIGIVTIVMCLYGFIWVLNERMKDADGKPTSSFRYARYHRLAYWGIGASLFTVVILLAIPASREFVFRALSGPPSMPTPPATVMLTLVETSTPTTAPTITPAPTVTPTPLAFAPAAEGETLILIARFHVTTATDTEPEVKIWRKIAEELEQLGESDMRVEVEPTSLDADAREEAESLGALYGASIVIWGEDTGVEAIVNYLNLREPEFEAAEAQIVERAATQLANPEAYAKFITQDLPGQVTFLALFAVAQFYYVDGDYPHAIQVLERAVDSTTNDVRSVDMAAAFFRLGWLYQQSEGDESDNVIANYDEAIELNGEDADAYTNRGNAYARRGSFDQAVADYTEAIKIDSRHALAYMNRGVVYVMQGEWEKALADHNQAIVLAPADGNAYYNRGVAYSGQGELELAIQDYTRAIALNDNDAATHTNRGNVYARQGYLEQAIADYTRAIEINPNYMLAYMNRGVAYGRQGEWEKAVVDHSQAITLAPDDGNAYYNRGVAYSGQGAWELAIQDYSKAVEINNRDVDAYYNRGNAYSAINEWELAVEDYAQVVQLAPDYDVRLYVELCWRYGLLLEPETALPYCDQAIERDHHPIAFDSRGLVYALLGDYGAASTDFQVYIDYLEGQTDPDDAGILAKRKAWVENLAEGTNPFTSEVLNELREE